MIWNLKIINIIWKFVNYDWDFHWFFVLMKKMNRLVQLCIGIIGVPFLIVGFSYFSQKPKNLPIEDFDTCVYQIISSWESSSAHQGIGSYWQSGVWVTAYHVVQECGNTCVLDIKNNQKSKSVPILDIQRIGTSDIALFHTSFAPRCQPLAHTTFVATFVSGVLQYIPVKIDGDIIDFLADYGQSGSPVYDGWIFVGVVSKRTEAGSFIELLP